ncbi:hypothetical protein SDRG_16371 [Saprolegnia diclina VS20]|uniref:Tail-anchored protein insertion receptor WRB n=1 Tax=Saprolegnia diclina (strain VS20) TaxID=1156394 RepID=T0PXL7_SAPDV|nr:hypothetical protein SDRG_16371 [Saprolegnia diclina VS20]EQC25775.1 hypothetical protein SDRG_16371 [Saprolegnia diclina VS20]|eukprot:XP_008620800.1 hypothetical protein SDRG_16371 [Saprolegnia diclina VS20]
MGLRLVEELDAPSLLILTLLCVLVEASMYYYTHRGERPGADELRLQKEHALLSLQAKKLNSVDMFVEHSKITRQMNTIKKQEQTLAMERMAQFTVSPLVKYVQPACLVLIVALYWNAPLVLFPSGYLMPLERLLAMPFFPAGVVSAGGWWCLCRRVLGKVLV